MGSSKLHGAAPCFPAWGAGAASVAAILVQQGVLWLETIHALAATQSVTRSHAAPVSWDHEGTITGEPYAVPYMVNHKW